MEIKIPAIEVSLFTQADNVEVNVGCNNHVVIDKVYGPTAFDEIRIHPDLEAYCWIIESPNEQGEWVECARIPAILEDEYEEEK